MSVPLGVNVCKMGVICDTGCEQFCDISCDICCNAVICNVGEMEQNISNFVTFIVIFYVEIVCIRGKM